MCFPFTMCMRDEIPFPSIFRNRTNDDLPVCQPKQRLPAWPLSALCFRLFLTISNFDSDEEYPNLDEPPKQVRDRQNQTGSNGIMEWWNNKCSLPSFLFCLKMQEYEK